MNIKDCKHSGRIVLTGSSMGGFFHKEDNATRFILYKECKYRKAVDLRKTKKHGTEIAKKRSLFRVFNF